MFIDVWDGLFQIEAQLVSAMSEIPMGLTLHFFLVIYNLSFRYPELAEGLGLWKYTKRL